MDITVARKFRANQEPGTGISSDKLGMWIFLASEVIFFAALISAIVSMSLNPNQEVNLFREHRDPYAREAIILATINTFILILSSVFVVSAIDAVQKGNQRMMKVWLWLTVIGGGAFLYNQSQEWAELSHILHTEFGFAEWFAGGTQSLFAAAFYTATGFHGLHVAIGVGLLLYVLIRAHRGDFNERRYNAIEMFGLYWHFVDLVWIILFTILYLI